MKWIIVFGVILMANSATINLAPPDKGVLTVQGLNAEFTASDFDGFKVEPAGSAMVNKAESSIILKPDLVMRDMGSSYVTVVFKYPALINPFYTPEYVAPPYREGEKSQYVALRTNDASFIYWVWGVSEFAKDQGILVNFSLSEYGGETGWADTGIDPLPEENMIFRFSLAGVESFLYFSIYPEKIQIKHRAYLAKSEDAFPVEKEWRETDWEVDIAENFKVDLSNESITSAVVFFKGEKIHIGINGVDNTIALNVPNTIEGAVMAESYFPVFAFRGQAQLAWQPLTFATESHIETPVYESPYKLNAPRGQLLKSDRPDGTSITVSGEVKTIGQDEAWERSEYYVDCDLKGDGVHTPSLYRFRASDAPVRTTDGSQSGTLTGVVDEIRLNETLNLDGSYGGGALNMFLSNVPDRAFLTQNTKMNSVITLGEGSGAVEFNINGYYVNTSAIQRPKHALYNQNITASPIVKRLETPFLEAISYDHMGYTHTELVEVLCTLAGVDVEMDTDTSGITLPVSMDADAPNWQYTPSSTIWQALQDVQEYSHWLMYSKDNKLQYRKFPKGSTDSKYEFAMNDDAFEDVLYTYTDYYRTRFLVRGLDDDGNLIFHLSQDDALESKIGESRAVVVTDPRLSSLDACKQVAEGLSDYYTTQHLHVNFMINRFENYHNLWIGDVVTVSDPQVSELSEGSFIVTSMDLHIGQFQSRCHVELRSLWT